MITLKKTHFAGMACYLGQDYVSNGHWAIKRDCVQNNAIFTTEEAARTVADIVTVQDLTFKSIAGGTAGNGTTPWTTSSYIYADQDTRLKRVANGHCRILSDGKGGIALLRVAYLTLLGFDGQGHVLYSTDDGKSIFRPTDVFDDAWFLLMPCRNDDLLPSPWSTT